MRNLQLSESSQNHRIVAKVEGVSLSSMQLISSQSSRGLVPCFDQLYLEIWLMAEFVHSMFLMKKQV